MENKSGGGGGWLNSSSFWKRFFAFGAYFLAWSVITLIAIRYALEGLGDLAFHYYLRR